MTPDDSLFFCRIYSIRTFSRIIQLVIRGQFIKGKEKTRFLAFEIHYLRNYSVDDSALMGSENVSKCEIIKNELCPLFKSL